jgi:hypothetical protein
MTTRKYTSRSQQTTLTSAVTSGALIIPVVSATTLLGGATVSAGQTFTIVIDPDTALEEVVDIYSPSTNPVSGNNLTIVRGIDGSSAQDHSAGAVIRHMIVGRDLREANAHIEASTYYNDGTSGTKALHGLGASDGAVVGSTQTATLTNKTIDATSNTVLNIADTNIKSGAAIAPAKIAGTAVTQADTGTVTSTMILDGTIVNADINASAAIAASKIAGVAVTQADTGTVTSTMIADGTIVNADINAAAAIALSKLATDPLARANHTGTQLASTISNFDTQVRTSTLNQMTAPTADLSINTHKLTSVVDPTSAQDAATKNYVDTKLSALVNGAPSTLDQLNELANAIANDPNYSTTITTALSTKLPLAGGTMSGAIAMGTNKITGLGDPTVAQDAVTLNYLTTLFGTTAAAATSAASAAASATAAATSATSSAASATAAATSATSAATQATAAATSATSAAASATAAATSATSSSTYATNSANSATAAATSATSAAASATAAATSATSSANSATASANSASTASTQASNASASATAAATSATSAAASATAAATSATSASTYASNASTYSNNSAASATAAATSATSAAASATAAATSATSSATSASSSLATYNQYKTEYLGTKTSAPSVDNQGGALIVGATYFNSVSSTMYVWNGSTWTAISTTGYSSPTIGTTTIPSGATVGTLNGVTLTSANVTVVADPVNNLDVATKQYVDAVTTAINFHAPVNHATTSNIVGTYSNGTSGVGATLTVTATGRLSMDGAAVSTNDRILVKDQTTQFQNGIYVVTNQGSAGVSAVLTRATDYDQPIEITNGDVVFCTTGTQNAGVTFVNSMATSPTVVGTTAITFSTYTSASLPTQTGNGGRFLTTDGTTPSWAVVSQVPSQTGNSGKYLTTDGTTASWNTPVDATKVPLSTYGAVGTIAVGTGASTVAGLSISTTAGYILTSTGTTAAWAAPAATYTAPTLGSTALASGATVTTVAGLTLSGATLTGTLTAGATSGTSGYYLQTTGTGVQWAAVAGYSAPTLGSTSIGSGATVTTINGLTKLVSTKYTSLDGASREVDITLMQIMGAY